MLRCCRLDNGRNSITRSPGCGPRAPRMVRRVSSMPLRLITRPLSPPAEPDEKTKLCWSALSPSGFGMRPSAHAVVVGVDEGDVRGLFRKLLGIGLGSQQ